MPCQQRDHYAREHVARAALRHPWIGCHINMGGWTWTGYYRSVSFQNDNDFVLLRKFRCNLQTIALYLPGVNATKQARHLSRMRRQHKCPRERCPFMGGLPIKLVRVALKSIQAVGIQHDRGAGPSHKLANKFGGFRIARKARTNSQAVFPLDQLLQARESFNR